jgi:hypothetical protein
MLKADAEAALHAVNILIWLLVYRRVLSAEDVAGDLDRTARLCSDAAAGRLYVMAHMARAAAWPNEEEIANDEEEAADD